VTRRVVAGVVLVGAVAVCQLLTASAQVATDIIPLPATPEIPGVITGGTRPELIAQGLQGADDPIWVPGVGLLFSEPNANRIVRLTEADALATFVGGLHVPLGMTVDALGRLISIQSEPGFVSIRAVWPPGEESLVAERFENLPFSRPNGITADRHGGLYVTDPGQSPAQEAVLRKTQTRLPPAVYYVPPQGSPIRVADRTARPNGVHLRRDETTLYVNDTNGLEAFAFDVLPDGRLANRRVFTRYAGRTLPVGSDEGVASGADDLVIDNEDRIYSVTAAGIEVFNASGMALGIIPVTCSTTGGRCQALAFGGPDKRQLYVAGRGTLLRLQMVAQGFAGRAK